MVIAGGVSAATRLAARESVHLAPEHAGPLISYAPGHRTPTGTANQGTPGTAPSAAGPTSSTSGLDWNVQTSPFRLVFLYGSHVLTAQMPGAPGPGDRMSYELANGSTHTLTNVLSSEGGGSEGQATYTVATDEHGSTGARLG
jgi:hypothetical protein